MRNFKWPSNYRVACPMYIWNLHFTIVSGARNAWVTFVAMDVNSPTQIKIFSFQNVKHGYLMQYLIRQSFEGYCCESELKWCLQSLLNLSIDTILIKLLNSPPCPPTPLFPWNIILIWRQISSYIIKNQNRNFADLIVRPEVEF